eukprot:g7435.t1
MALVPADNSFLSLLNVERKQALDRQKKREEIWVCLITSNIESKLSANEKAFFVAYKSFMFTVQKEFKELKQKADEEETKTRRDAKIQSTAENELDKWKGKAEALEDDRQFLEGPQRQDLLTKTFKAETQTDSESWSRCLRIRWIRWISMDHSDHCFQCSHHCRSCASLRLTESTGRTNKSLRTAVEQAQSSAYAALVNAEENQPVSAPEVTQADEEVLGPAYTGLSQERREGGASSFKRLKHQLQQEQKQATKLRAIADRQFTEPSELEAFFVDCVEQVKGDISQRRKLALEQRQALRGPEAKGPRGYPETLPPQVAKLALEPTLDDFTVTDRRKVVELLLSSEQVLQFLYDKLFPD